MPGPKLLAWAAATIPAVDVLGETPGFVDYWISVAGAKALKADWDATWRGWMRRQKSATAEKPRVTAAQRNLATVAHFRNLEEQKRLELEA